MKFRYLLFSGIILFSCKPNEDIKPKVESLSVYEVVINNGKPLKGKPLYKEAFEYNTDGQISQHFLYDELGELRSREIYPKQYMDLDTIKTSYYDANNALQSNYVKVLDELKNKIEVNSYEAATGDLLRIEKFEYDSNNNLTSKKVYTGDNELYRHQQFEYDSYGNEIGIKIFDENNKQIFSEEYDLSTLDGNNNWVEKWGYQEGVPKSFRKRVLIY